MNFRNTLLVFCLAPVICVTSVRAQDQKQGSQQADPSAPVQPMNSGLGGGYQKSPAPAARGVASSADGQPYGSAQVLPDQNTLAGAQMFGVGSLQHTRNIFDPAISVSELGLTGQNLTGTTTTGPTAGISAGSGITSETLVGGSLSFDRSWDIFHINAIYNGGETFFEGPFSSHYQFHDVTFVDQADWARWHIIVRDNFVATPGAEFTGSGMGGPGLVAQFSSTLGSSMNSIAQSFTPTETIETGNVMRYLDTVLGQAEYSFSRRSAITFSSSYGLLHFSGPGYINSDMFNVQGGYDYLLDPNNSVAILGSYGKIDYTNRSSSTSDYTAAFAYGRKVTGRLGFQASTGPQAVDAVNSTNGSVVGATSRGDFHLLIWTINSALTYTRRRTGASLAFSRGLTAGSGVFIGAVSDTVSGSAHYQFTRHWTGSVSGGYAVNNSLAPSGTKGVQFDNWFLGANLGRSVGRHAQVNFNYGLQKQSIPAICPVASCGISGIQQTFGSTFNWHLRRSD